MEPPQNKDLLLLLSIIIAALLYTRVRRSSYRRRRLPPGPRGLPMVGNLLALGDQPHRSLARLAKSYGPLMTVSLGRVTTVVASSPAAAREVIRTNDQTLSGRSVPDAVHALGVSSVSVVWLPVGDVWRSLRKICSKGLFSAQRVEESRELRWRVSREMAARVRGHVGEVVDVGAVAFAAMVSFISTTLFSVDVAEDAGAETASGFRDLVWEIMVESGRANVSDFFPEVAWLDLQGRRRRATAYQTRLHEIFDGLIDARMAADDAGTIRIRRDFLDTLVEWHVKGDGDGKLDRHTMKSLLGDLFIAGTDTSSHTVEWAMAELLRNPKSMSKACAELSETISAADKEVDETDISRLPYLQAVVKETLRLHPPTPLLIPRRAETTVDLCGYTIPEGTRILVNVWAIGRDPDVWADADLFKPERFMGQEIDYKGRDFELIPFGGGRRICPGLPLAFRMVHLMLASLLHTFDWKLPEGMEPEDINMDDKFGLTLAKAVPLRALPTSK